MSLNRRFILDRRARMYSLPTLRAMHVEIAAVREDLDIDAACASLELPDSTNVGSHTACTDAVRALERLEGVLARIVDSETMRVLS